MQITRCQLLQIAGAAVGALALPRLTWALDYPTRPVRIVVGFPPGGVADIYARLIGQWLSQRLGQQFIVDNRPGAGSNIATEAVVHGPPDGYTLLLAYSSNAINATLYSKLNFNFLRDIAPVGGVMREPLVILVNPSFPTKTVADFTAYTKANPGKVNMASAGVGTATHVAGELFKAMTGLNMQHVPYRGGAPVLTDLIGGQVQVYFGSPASSIEYIRAGKLRALAVTTATRSEALPNIPTVGDFLPGYEATQWYGVGAPKDTPTEIIEKLNGEINAALADPSIKARFGDLGGMVFPTSPAEFGKFIAAETEKWGKVVKYSGAKAD
jgi:tripartite-type tricarboxylate transporter receptor subunit TctC